MTYTLVWGAKLLTFDGLQKKIVTIDDGALVEKDGIILKVGKREDLKRLHPEAEELGSSRCLVLPGLVNAHHHGKGLTNFQLGTLDEGLELWMLELRKQRKIDPYLDTLYATIKHVEAGVTTVMHSHYRRDNGGYELELSEAFKAYLDSGLRVALSLGIKNCNTFVYHDDSEFIDSLPTGLRAGLLRSMNRSEGVSQEEFFSIVRKYYEKYDGKDGRFKILLGPVGPQWCSDDLLVKIGEEAEKLKAGLHFHALESAYQKEYYRRRYGKSLISHIDELGLLGPKVSCAHAVWVDEQDMDLLAETGTTLVHNPSSNLRLRSGIMPIGALFERGINVALGTDGMSLNDDDDLIQEMRLCLNLHRLPGLGSFCPTASEVFRMATINGAAAVLMGESIGTLEEGKAADVILVKGDHIFEPYTERDVDPLHALLYRGRGSDVETVMVGGRVLMKDKRITFVDKEAVMEGLRKSLKENESLHTDDDRLLLDQLKPYILEFYNGWEAGERRSRYIYNNIC